MGILRRLWAVLSMRCPRCCRGKVFRGMFAMNDPCPVCGLIFQREEGYFLGAMYASYFMAIPVLALIAAVIHWLILPDWKRENTVLVAIVPFLDEGNLHKQFKLNEPWDSEHNLKLLAQMPAVYRVGIEPKDATHTYYQVFAGPGTPECW